MRGYTVEGSHSADRDLQRSARFDCSRQNRHGNIALGRGQYGEKASGAQVARFVVNRYRMQARRVAFFGEDFDFDDPVAVAVVRTAINHLGGFARAEFHGVWRKRHEVGDAQRLRFAEGNSRRRHRHIAQDFAVLGGWRGVGQREFATGDQLAEQEHLQLVGAGRVAFGAADGIGNVARLVARFFACENDFAFEQDLDRIARIRLQAINLNGEDGFFHFA